MSDCKKYLSALLSVLALSACGGKAPEAPAAVAGYRAEVFTAKTMGGMLDPVSKAFLLVGEQGSILRSQDGYSWDYAATPTQQRLHGIAGDSRSGVLIAVGAAGTVLRSTDAGRSWQQVKIEMPAGVDLAQAELREIIHHPAKDIWLAAGTHNAILRSIDQGQNWRVVSFDSSAQKLEILDLFVESASGDFLLAAQHGAMGRSRDGADWKIVYHDMEAAGEYIPHLVAFYELGDALIAVGDEGRLLLSWDRGQTWKLSKLPTSGYFTGGAYDPVHHSIVLTTQEGDDIAYSLDQGHSWRLTRLRVRNWPGDDIPMLSEIVYDAKTRALLAMGSSGIVARSIDGGGSWEAGVLKPLFNLSLTTLLHDPERDLFIASGLGGFIAVTRGLLPDPAVGWRVVRPGIDLYMREVAHVPGTDTFVIVGELGGIWRSEDDGSSWDVIEPKYPYPNQPPYLRDIIIDPSTQALVAAGPDGSIMRSTDAGRSWKPVFQGVITLGEAFTQVLADQGHRALIACEATYQTVYRSGDGGASWEKAANLQTGGRNLWHGAVSEKLGLVMIAGQRGIIAISGDGGSHWELPATGTSEDLYGAFADAASGALFAVGDWGMLLRSEDGRQWRQVNTGTRSTLRRMFADPASGALLAFGQEGVILRSTDGGKSWRKAASPDLDSELRKALAYPDGKLVIVGRDGVILLSGDGGASWGRVPSHTDEHFRSAALNPGTGTLIAVGDGLVRLSRVEEKKN
ncbi:MAG TPA: YCF48-related protein [Gammaproteobacteria bacterium]|nr:YCF48-related protein [Gammaproteobacteria bacterium]